MRSFILLFLIASACSSETDAAQQTVSVAGASGEVGGSAGSAFSGPGGGEAGGNNAAVGAASSTAANSGAATSVASDAEASAGNAAGANPGGNLAIGGASGTANNGDNAAGDSGAGDPAQNNAGAPGVDGSSAAGAAASGADAGADAVVAAGGVSAQGVAGAANDVAPIDAADWVLDPDTPLSTDAPEFPSIEHPLKPNELWGDTPSSPLPTNEFWMSFALGTGEQRVNALPYHLRALEAGLGVARPDLEVSAAGILTAGYTQLVITSDDSVLSHSVVSYDDLSVTLAWETASGSFTAPVVYGMPYASARYSGATPRIETPGAAILEVNGSTESPVTATAVELELNSGQVWRVYSTESITWSWNANELVAEGAVDSWVRATLVTSSENGEVLDQYAGAIPTGGSVGLFTAGDLAQVDYAWQRDGEGELLMMALPHHVTRLAESAPAALEFTTLRGVVTGQVGDTWSLLYPLSTIAWTPPRPVQDSAKDAIVSALEADRDFNAVDTGSYGSGKEATRLATYALIASELDQPELAATFLDALRPLLSSWLDGENAVPLVYDTTWGGLVTARGAGDEAADFGMGYYNDHHFHYGYHIYAAAVLAREDTAWAAEYAHKVMWYIRDIANPSRADGYFPKFRAMDWFVGHSWAAGLFDFADGRNQESSSEAVHAWYGIELFGRAIGDANLTALGRVLRATETASVQEYWQVTDESIYPAPFSDNHGMGIIWETKVDFSTWFGNNPEYIYGIQMLPFTPASESLFDPAWVQAAWPQMSDAASGAEEPWAGFLYMTHAVIDVTAAENEMAGISRYDNGNSAANALYWLATRPR